MCFNKKGFTLIELLVVMIIVGILAAVAIPMMRGNVLKARRSEATAALGTIRTAERAYFAEYNTYIVVAAATRVADLATIGIGATDLDGRFYSTSCYTVAAGPGGIATSFTATANPNTPNNTATRAADVNGTGNVTIDEVGTMTGY